MTRNESREKQRVAYQKEILCHKHIVTKRQKKTVKQQQPISIYIKNISYKGIGITSSKDLSMGDFLILKLELAQETKEIMMEVKWCKYMGNGYEAGLQFMYLTQSGTRFLEKLVGQYRQEI